MSAQKLRNKNAYWKLMDRLEFYKKWIGNVKAQKIDLD